MKFNPRLSTPASENGWYFDASKNIYEAKHIGSCTQYAFGRLSEILNKKIGYKDTWYPIDLYNRCAEAGFEKSATIGLGFGAVWEKLDGSMSHISVVEEVNGEDGKCSMWDINSNFFTHEIRKADGYKYRFDGYRFVGFINIKAVFESASEDYTKSTVPERFKVVKNGKQINSYTKYKYAVADADKNNAQITDGKGGPVIYPVPEVASTTKTPSATTTIVLTPTSYPDYTDGSVYRVRKSFTDERGSAGSFSIWRNAYSRWASVKSAGYHIYDRKGNQLD